MTRARFKDLVLDANDVASLGRFWAQATGLELNRKEDGDAVLTDGVAEHTIWVNAVPELRQAKQRVHLDLHAASTGDLEALGATIDTAYPRWTVLRDPEGGEFCAFPRERSELRAYRVYEVVVDAADPELIASWWGARFETAPQHDAGDPYWWLEPGSGNGLPWPLVFNQVPEPKVVKNRIHWDVWGSRDAFLAGGATLLRARDDEIRWDVLGDPEGNEFCVFAPVD